MDKALDVLKELEAQAKEKSIPCIGQEKGKIMESVIGQHSPVRILEIGTLWGYSAILMARLLPEGGKLVTIEANEESARIAEENVSRAGLEDKIEVMTGDAFDILPNLQGEFDLIFIDATKVEYLRYLKLAEKNLKTGSIVVADNVGIFEKDMGEYLEYVRTPQSYRSRTVKVALEAHPDVEDAMEISVKL